MPLKDVWWEKISKPSKRPSWKINFFRHKFCRKSICHFNFFIAASNFLTLLKAKIQLNLWLWLTKPYSKIETRFYFISYIINYQEHLSILGFYLISTICAVILSPNVKKVAFNPSSSLRHHLTIWNSNKKHIRQHMVKLFLLHKKSFGNLKFFTRILEAP